MKAIIYAGISLFSVATVYGVVDYYSSQKRGTLDKLYKEEDVPAAPEIKKEITTVIPVKNVEVLSTNNKTMNIATKAAKKLKAKRTMRLEDFSRGRIDEVLPVEKVKLVEPIIEKPTVKELDKLPVSINEAVITKKEPERKLSLEMFSRAPLKKTPKLAKKSVTE